MPQPHQEEKRGLKRRLIIFTSIGLGVLAILAGVLGTGFWLYREYQRGKARDDAKKRYIIDLDQQVVTDTKTGLMWVRHHRRDADSLRKAQEYCDELVHGAYSDWRLPKMSELRSLVIGCENVNGCESGYGYAQGGDYVAPGVWDGSLWVAWLRDPLVS